MDINHFQKQLGVTVNQAMKDSIPLTQVTAVLDTLSFELKFKLMRQLEKQNELPTQPAQIMPPPKIVIEHGGNN